MKEIGEKSRLQFIYEFKENPFDNEIAWGSFQFYVNNKDICEIMRNGERHKYEWNLTYLIEWLVDNIEYIIGHDPFPFPSIYSDNLNDMIDLAQKREFEIDLEYFLWYGALSDWDRRHTWSANDDGSRISRVFFYRRENEIEIAWNNKDNESGKIKHIFLIGSEKIEIQDFIDTILDFLKNIISDLRNLYEENKFVLELEKKYNLFISNCD